VVFAALFCTVLFSLSIVCGHRSAKQVGGTEANFWRLVVASVLLGLWAYTLGTRLEGVALPWLLFSGLVGIGVGDVAMFQALPRLGSRLSVLLVNCLVAPVAALIEWAWLGTTIKPAQMLTVLVILAGVAIALAPGKRPMPRDHLVRGILFCALSALAGAAGPVLSRKAYAVAAANGQFIDAGTAAFQRTVGGLLISAGFLLVVKHQHLCARHTYYPVSTAAVPIQKWRGLWPWVLLNGLAGQTLGVSCMQYALKTVPTGLVMAIIAATPVVVIPFAFVFEDELPNARSLTGSFVAVAGLISLVLLR
jgi:drug/metabolite transporter (DMT)-like permease